MSNTITPNGIPHAGEHHGKTAPASPAAARNGHPPMRAQYDRREAEAFDALLWRLQARQSEGSAAPLTIGLLGCEARTGVTTLAANLAVRASEQNLGPVLLVETDIQRPRIRSAWRLPAGPGLAELLTGQASYADCLVDGPGPDLHVIPAGGVRRGKAPVWDSAIVDALLTEATADHSLVLFDLPSAERLQHTALLARRLDQVLLVVRAEQTQTADAQRTADRLLDDGVPLVGVVLNRCRRYVPRWLQRWI